MSDSGDSDVAWTFYMDRPEWNDVTPVPEDEGPNLVVVIAHSEKCKYSKHVINVSTHLFKKYYTLFDESSVFIHLRLNCKLP